MGSRSILTLCLALFLAIACSESDGGGGSGATDTVNGDSAQSDTQSDTQSDAADSDAADDSVGDTGETGDTTVTLPFSEAFIDSLCDRLCGRKQECNVPPVDDCRGDCQAAIIADPGYAKSIACWMNVEGACETPAACADPVPDDPDCVANCNAATDCGLFPHLFLGDSAAECIVNCSGFVPVASSPEEQATLTCIYAGIADCDLAAIEACFGGMEGGPCDDMCDAVGDCDNMGVIFGDREVCMSDCAGWGMDRAMAANACATFGRDEDEELTDATCQAQGQCFPPPTAPATDADAFCAELLPLCSAHPDFGFSTDQNACVWLMTGFAVQLPGADFAAGTTCLEAMDSCEDMGIVFGCLVPTYAPCQGFCEGLDDCMSNPPPADWPGVEACVAWCSQVAVQDTTTIDNAITCTEASSSCEDFFACLPESAQ